ncbi:hypothetical protein EYF80_007827 [Liparis tanakae]|uniref:Uncharacterized protein n=1 Tax=Liparis tanakae TaxID=230148 RepID=A0A4Z2IV99_9TELE|nr:hypothetical protein EYF80_007827 [Liparis tanakae]
MQNTETKGSETVVSSIGPSLCQKGHPSQGCFFVLGCLPTADASLSLNEAFLSQGASGNLRGSACRFGFAQGTLSFQMEPGKQYLPLCAFLEIIEIPIARAQRGPQWCCSSLTRLPPSPQRWYPAARLGQVVHKMKGLQPRFLFKEDFYCTPALRELSVPGTWRGRGQGKEKEGRSRHGGKVAGTGGGQRFIEPRGKGDEEAEERKRLKSKARANTWDPANRAGWRSCPPVKGWLLPEVELKEFLAMSLPLEMRAEEARQRHKERSRGDTLAWGPSF